MNHEPVQCTSSKVSVLHLLSSISVIPVDADLALFQRETSNLRGKLGGCLPAPQAAAVQDELETAQRALTELQQHVHDLESKRNFREATQTFMESERSVLLAKVSDVEQERARLQKQLQLRHARTTADCEDSIKAILMDKDSEIDRLKSVIMKEQADTSLRIQTVTQAQVRF